MDFKERLFLFLAGIFLTALVLGNVIGTTKFIDLIEIGSWKMVIPAGLLAYPFTFLATDLICELYGRKRAQWMVWVGFFMNVFLLLLMSLGNWLPDAEGVSGATTTYEAVYEFMVGNVTASMIAYLIAQSVDVHMFHFWKRLTKGKHLWLRNNASTLCSQLVDTIAIITILYLAGNLGSAVQTIGDLAMLILSAYVFKFFFALFDTPLFYVGVWLFKDRVHADPNGLAGAAATSA